MGSQGESLGRTVVELIHMGGPTPVVVRGFLISSIDGSYVVELDDDGGQASVGAPVILNIQDGETPRVIATIAGVQGQRLRLAARRQRARERRVYPRLHGAIPMRYRIVPAHAITPSVGSEWSSTGRIPAAATEWLQPDEFMNFSVTGLSFESEHRCAVGDLALIDLGIRSVEERWRCVALVVWASNEPVSRDESAAGSRYRIAIHFEELPPAAEAALTDMTLAIQEAFM